MTGSLAAAGGGVSGSPTGLRSQVSQSVTVPSSCPAATTFTARPSVSADTVTAVTWRGGGGQTQRGRGYAGQRRGVCRWSVRGDL